MREKIELTPEDRIAIIAPHPDDECLGVGSVLMKAADKTDIFVLTDGSHGNPEKTIEEEAIIRRKQFEAEMEYVKPHSWHWIGVEDTKLIEYQKAAENIDFTPYTKIFLPWSQSFHPDHRVAETICRREIRKQKATADCFSYEINAPFYRPTHYIDITGLEEEKLKLVSFHEDQKQHGPITLSLNALRGAQMLKLEEVKTAECFIKLE